MAKYDVCPVCGATLDHGETCDCETEERKESCVCQNEEKTE